MWNPDFPVAEIAPARLAGYARRFCLYSTLYRGTSEQPGLVLGLDPDEDAICDGMALRVDEKDWPEALAGLRARELVTNAYLEITHPVTLDDGREVPALTYVVRHDHPQYAGELTLDEMIALIERAHGARGPNREYVLNTAAHLAEAGIPDANIAELARRLI